MKIESEAQNLFANTYKSLTQSGDVESTPPPRVDKEVVQLETSTQLDNVRTNAVQQLKNAKESDVYALGEVDMALEKINKYAEIQQVNLRLSVDKELNRVVIRVVDKDTDEMIRQIPSEQAIALAKRIDEVMQEFFIGKADQAINLFDDRA
ncbi:Uncharacterized conserved protein, FlaG/YvyC family [Oceanospirillum multiglobuliferum]|uniref:Flagellar biosynthesis protein FlaG n=1 Tax=Oceanospirillum multiglobuliferum TaxID=64969 RepID=A0A1T4L2T9_9GAMM|nr:flagellar protein FlaG [Oceanospirillum multiglobuliferum]OPX56823.1 hypothetical protein BTE48_02805 [Oceanospirillum multiglobuliferum]SJZ49062.1 Uncharacterized conserved protein, FlaG/YvyC family [Oceanospirillum multiglobuliferum]